MFARLLAAIPSPWRSRSRKRAASRAALSAPPADPQSNRESMAEESPSPPTPTPAPVTTTTVAKRQPPLHVLPDELLAEIFFFYIHTDSSEMKHGLKVPPLRCTSNYNPHTPMILGRVCSEWRNISISTPRLWSHIYVSDPYPGHAELFALWLARSQSAALHLTIEVHWFSDRARQAPSLVKIFNTALPAFNRVEHLSLQIQGTDIGDSWREARAPNLRSLNLLLSDWKQETAREFFLQMASGSQTISVLSIPSFALEPLVAGVPYKPLTHLRIEGGIDSAELISILQECTVLEKLYVGWLEPTVPVDTAPTAVVRLPLLKDLHIRSIRHYAQALDVLDLPALKELFIGLHPEYEKVAPFPPKYTDGIWRIVARLGARSGCRLEKFTMIGGWRDTSDGGATVLTQAMFEDVKEIYLDVRIGTKTIRALTFGPRARAMPRLQNVHFRECVAPQGVVEDLLDSRILGMGSPLLDFYVSIGITEKTPITLDRMKWLRRGVRVTLHSFMNR